MAIEQMAVASVRDTNPTEMFHRPENNVNSHARDKRAARAGRLAPSRVIRTGIIPEVGNFTSTFAQFDRFAQGVKAEVINGSGPGPLVETDGKLVYTFRSVDGARVKSWPR